MKRGSHVFTLVSLRKCLSVQTRIRLQRKSLTIVDTICHANKYFMNDRPNMLDENFFLIELFLQLHILYFIVLIKFTLCQGVRESKLFGLLVFYQYKLVEAFMYDGGVISELNKNCCYVCLSNTCSQESKSSSVNCNPTFELHLNKF